MSDQLFINNNPLTFEVNEKAALKLRKKYAKIIKKKGLEPGSKTVIDHFYDEDVKKNTVLIQGLGVSVRGSVQYILNELNYDKKFAKYKIYVRTKDHTDETVNEYIKQKTFCHILPHFDTFCHILPLFDTFCHFLPHLPHLPHYLQKSSRVRLYTIYTRMRRRTQKKFKI